MFAMSKSKHSEKSKKHGFWKKTLFGVFVVLLVVVAANVFQTQSSLTGYPVYSRSYIGEAGGVSPVGLHDFVITMENRTLTLDGAVRNLTLLRLLGANNTLRLENGYQNYFLYVVIDSRDNPLSYTTSYIGRVVYYNYTANQWKTLSLYRDGVRYNNILNTTSPRRGFGITYITNNLTNARTPTAQILVSGTINPGNYFSGNLQVIDGFNATAFNSTLGQGGTWDIPFSKVGLGATNNTSANYLYYDSAVGPQNSCYGPHCARVSPPISYTANVRYYNSPAGVMLETFSRTRIQLRETSSPLNSFKFTCTDSDPANDPYIAGSVSLANPLNLSSGYAAGYDRCMSASTANATNEYVCTTGLSDNLDNNGCGTSSSALSRSTNKAAYNAALPRTWKEVSDSDWSALGLGSAGTVGVIGSSTASSTQRQFLEVFSKTQYDDQQDSYVANGMEAMWRTTFSAPLPMCADTSKSYAACDASDKIDATSAPTIITILGYSWVVTGAAMTGTNAAISSLNVGKAYLVRKTLRVGEETAVAGTPFKIRVDQVNAPAGVSSLPSCNIVISDATNRSVLITRDRDSPAVKVTELGDIYVKVSAIGYSAAAGAINTCEVSAYSDSITLSNSTINQTLYPNWKAVLDSNNRSGTQGLSDLRIYNDNWVYPSTGNIKAKPGDKFTMVNGLTSNASYVLEFRGSDLKPADFDTLTVSEDEGFSATIGGTAGEWAALKFCSNRTDAFRFGTENVRCVNLITKNKTSPGSNNNYTGYVVYQNSSGTWVNASGSDVTRTFYNSTRGANLTVVLPLYYYGAGGGSDTSVRINVTFDGMSSGKGDCVTKPRGCSAFMGSGNYGWNYTRLIIQIPEIDNESTSSVAGSGIWTTYYLFDSAAGAAGNFRDATADGTTTNRNVNYTANAFGIVFNSEPPYCSVRGSCVEAAGHGASSFILKYATRLGKAVYVLRKIASTVNATTTANAMITQSADCNALTQLPQVNYTSVMCPTSLCNAANTACAR